MEKSAGAPVVDARLVANQVTIMERIKGLASSIASQSFHGFLLSTRQVRLGLAIVTMKKDWVEWSTHVDLRPIYERHTGKSNQSRRSGR